MKNSFPIFAPRKNIPLVSDVEDSFDPFIPAKINVSSLIKNAIIHVSIISFWEGKSIMVSVSVCKVGCPGSSPARSVCYRKVEIYQHVINLFPPVLMTGSTKAVHV